MVPTMARPALMPVVLVPTLGLLVLTLTACGHPATRDDCELILTRSAELKLKDDNVVDPQKVAERLEGLKQARGDELLKSCIGRTITKTALDCVQRAPTSEAVDACLY
jgi:hypothetical protein